jgi:hypothetical protein
MPLVGTRKPSGSAPSRAGGVSRFLLSPHFTGLILPALILAVGAIYHLAVVGNYRQTEKELQEELRILKEERDTLELRLKAVESEVETLKRTKSAERQL